MARILAIFLCSALVAAVSGDAGARTWRLESDGSGECPSLKAGVDSAAAFGDTLLLAPGIYKGPDNREVDFLGKDICVTSSGGAGVTTIDCESGGRGFMLMAGESGEISSLTITNTQWGWGAGVYIVGGSPLIQDNIFLSNMGSRGGAIHVRGGSPDIVGNTFDSNNGSEWGGAIYVVLQSPTISGNVIRGSEAISGSIYMMVANGTVESNTIVENNCGGLYLSAADPVVTLNIIAFSTAGRAITCQSSANPTVDCNLFYGNLAGDEVCGTDAGDNLNTDPLFCGDPLSGDYTLESGSPCAPGNNACAAGIGAFGVGCTSSPVLPATWGRLKSQYLGGN
jgi:hypothetical protein